MTDISRSISPYSRSQHVQPYSRINSSPSPVPYKPSILHEPSYHEIKYTHDSQHPSPAYNHPDQQQIKPQFIPHHLPDFGRNSDINLTRKNNFNSPLDHFKRNKEIIKASGMIDIPEKDKVFLSLLKANDSATSFKPMKESLTSLAKYDKSLRSPISSSTKPPLPKSASKSSSKFQHKPNTNTKTKTNRLPDEDIEKSDWSSLVRSIVLDNKKISQESIQNHSKGTEIHQTGSETERPSNSHTSTPTNQLKPQFSCKISLSKKHIRI